MDTILFERFLKPKDNFVRVGQEIVFEGEEAYIIRVRPYLVIKTKNRVVCGALQNRIFLRSN